MQTQMKVTKATAKALDWRRSTALSTVTWIDPVNWRMTWRTFQTIRVFEPLFSNEISPRELSSRRDEIRKSVSQRPVFHSFNSNSNHSNHHSRRHHSFHR